MALGELRAGKAVGPLVSVLGDSSAGMPVRRKAAWALGKIKNKRAVKPLIKALSVDDTALRKAAANSLTQIGTPAVSSLLNLIKDRKHPYRNGAMTLLGRLGNKKALPALIAAIEDSDYRARSAALAAAAAIAPRKAAPKLSWGLNDEEVTVRRTAAQSLVKAASAAEIAPISLAIRKDKDSEVRMGCVQALGALGDRRGLPALVYALGKDAKADVRLAAVAAMNKIRHKGIIKALKAAALDQDREVREAADALLQEMYKK